MKIAGDLLKWYNIKKRRELWSVGENFRFMDQMNIAAEEIRRLRGDVVTFSVRLYAYIDDQDEAYQTEWYVDSICHDPRRICIAGLTSFHRRRNPKYPGGPLLDCGIHYVAAIRYLLAAAGQPITHVSAFTSQVQPRLPPPDTLHATMQLDNSHNGTFSLSFGARHKAAFEFQVVTDNGTVTMTPDMVHVLRKSFNGKPEERQHRFKPIWGASVRSEVKAFAEAISVGKMEQRASPEEAFMDLKVLHAMLESGENGGAPKSLR